MAQALPNDDAFQYLVTDTFEFVRLTARTVSDEVTRANRIHVISYGGLRLTLKNIHAFFLVEMHMKFGSFTTWLYFNDVKSDTAQPSEIA